MKIEKGKLYYNRQLESVVIAVEDSYDTDGILSNKIAVHCKTKEDWEYVNKITGHSINPKYYLGAKGIYSYLDHSGFDKKCNEKYHNISTEQFKEFYPEKDEKFNIEDFRSNIDSNDPTEETVFKKITDSISDLLEYKNSKYGNAVLEPLNIFNGKCKAGTRIDDKLSRIKNSKEGLRKNDICDLIGYLILTCKENNWTDFSEFKD